MIKKIILFFIAIVLISETQAQFTRYIVWLKNKAATTFTLSNPAPYLSQRAIDRRTFYNIAVDSSDLPVPSSYILQIKGIPNVTVLNVSRWMNAISISTNDANAITAINALSFVQSTSAIAARSSVTQNKYHENITGPIAQRGADLNGNNFFDYGATSLSEIHIHEGEFLHNIGLRGQGMQIAMLDGGFFQYTSFDAFDSANANNQFLETWDFVAREQSVVEDNSHGMSCLSTIAANIPGQFVGMAPKASFRLYRTEDASSEYPIEEFNWACGAERADSAGANVISSSVGYNTDFDDPVFNHVYADMNGDKIITTIAADLAAKKGMLVVVSAGNEGTLPWHYITSPADADSVIAVGAVNTAGMVGTFSSYGPSADGRIKPDVASVGVGAVIQTQFNTVGLSNGTSFAAPKMAGLSTALWQGFPEFNNMRIVRALKESGSIFSSPNDRIGYGIPNMKVAFAALLKEFATSTATVNDCDATINWTSKDVVAMKYEIERKAPGESSYTKVGEMTPQAGIVLNKHDYHFTNSIANIPIGTVSYRIRQVIDTAVASFTAVYIDTTEVVKSSPCIIEDKVLIAPNPATSNNATLIVQTGYDINKMPVAIYDMQGKLVMQLSFSKNVVQSTFDIPIARLAKGKYIVKVYNDAKEIGTTILLKL